MGLLDGKVAIVTGAGRGIGREEALLLSSEGARVIVNDVGGALTNTSADEHPAEDVVALIKERGGEAAVNGDDISSWEGGKNVVEQAVDTFGGLDILVNNAGILRDKMSFNMEESDWDDVIRVHLKGHFAPTHHAAVYWRNKAKAGEDVSGRIINTSSEAGLYGNAGQANYSAAKAGLQGFTKTLAIELGQFGITANAVAPGFIATDMTAATASRVGMDFDDFQKAAASQIPVRRVGSPDDVAHVISFLVSEGAGFVSGQVIYVAGGPLC